jgi:hypothetical protein
MARSVEDRAEGALVRVVRVRCPFLIPTLTNSTEDQKRGLTCGYAGNPYGCRWAVSSWG